MSISGCCTLTRCWACTRVTVDHLCSTRQRGPFVVGEQPGPREEAQALGALEREHATASDDDVDGEMRMLPVFELRRAHVERRAADIAQLDVGSANEELSHGIAHRARPIATPARLMKHERSVLGLQACDQFERCRRGIDPRNHIHCTLQKKKTPERARVRAKEESK